MFIPNEIGQTLWDKWRAPYRSVRSGYEGCFDIFDTGEVVCTLRGRPNPDYRGAYGALGVSVYTIADKGCPGLYLSDGTPVAKAWFAQAQAMLIDHETGMAVRLFSQGAYAHDRPAVEQMPSRFVTTTRGTNTRYPLVGAYFPGPGRRPVGAAITLTRPAKQILKPEEIARVNEITQHARAILTMKGLMPYRGTYGHWVSPNGATIPMSGIHAGHLLAMTSAADLEIHQMQALVVHGMAKIAVDHPYLSTNPDGSIGGW